jgi:uncharacterized protein YjeT (DUF2065 family)
MIVLCLIFSPAIEKELIMDMENNSGNQLSRGMQFVLIGIAIVFTVLVVAVTILAFVTDV